ncbi:MAG: ABC transporter permease [Lachnospiraceae bacterium]
MVRRFFSQALLYHKGRTAAFHLEEFLCFDAGYPLLTMIFYCLLASYSFQTTSLTYWVIGNAFLLCTNTCIFTLGGIFTGERYNGRLRSIIAAPGSKLSLILAGGVFPAVISSATVALGFVIGGLIFGVDFSELNFGLAILTIICAMLSATCFGMFIAVFGLISDSMHLVLNIVSYVIMIFTGAEFPVTQLPLIGQILAKFLPLTHTIQAMNLLFEAEQSSYWGFIGTELLIAACYALLTWGIFRTAERIACRSGRFDMY